MKINPIQLIILLLITVLFSFAVYAEDSDDGPAINRVKGPLSVMVLGSGGPMEQTSGRASAGYLIFIEGIPRILMDLGGGTYQRIAQSGAHIASVNIVLISHLHIDHSADLPAAVKGIYFDGRLTGNPVTNPIQIWGPDSNNPTFPAIGAYLEKLFSDGGVYSYLVAFVNGGGLGHFGYTPNGLSPEFNGASINTIVDEDGLVIKEIAIDHYEAPAVAYRIEYKGRSVVYTGDTHSSTDNIAMLAQDADLLIYDTSILENAPPSFSPFAKRHTTPTRMGQIAALANPRKLVLSHITPVTDPVISDVKATIHGQGYHGRISEAHDLQVYNLGDDD